MAEFKKIGRDIYTKVGYVQAGALYDSKNRRIGVERRNEFFLVSNSSKSILKLDERGNNILDGAGKLFMEKNQLSRYFGGSVGTNEVLPLAAFLYLEGK